MPIRRALISCTDKTGLADLARFLAGRGVEIVSTGGTAKLLRAENIPAREVSDFTGFPELLDGRVKTLHPRVHGGILGRRDSAEHVRQMRAHGIAPIDIVVVNLYAFVSAVSAPGCTLESAIENIDIGGPSLLRSAAKNHRDVVVLADPADYARVMTEIGNTGDVGQKTRYDLAVKAFALTANYDAAITRYLGLQKTDDATPASKDASKSAPEELPDLMTFSLKRVHPLRYGENPHQRAAFYAWENGHGYGLPGADILQGKELSYNNILDAQSALSCCREFDAPACVIVKHNNPCGAAVEGNISTAFINARACDPNSSFGGIVAFNRGVDAVTARLLAETFFEVIVAPDFATGARDIFSAKKNLRLLRLTDFGDKGDGGFEIRGVDGGLLMQEPDRACEDAHTGRIVTKRQPTLAEWESLTFAWAIAKHVKSNAIVYARDRRTVGIGAGQMSRVDAVKLGIAKAQLAFTDSGILKGAVLAGDAFFPFRDGLDEAAKSGITAVIQPGGSVRDAEVIAAADESNIAMVCTGVRHFRH